MSSSARQHVSAILEEFLLTAVTEVCQSLDVKPAGSSEAAEVRLLLSLHQAPQDGGQIQRNREYKYVRFQLQLLFHVQI